MNVNLTNLNERRIRIIAVNARTREEITNIIIIK